MTALLKSLLLSTLLFGGVQFTQPAQAEERIRLDLAGGSGLLPDAEGILAAQRYSQSTWVASFVPGLGQMILDEPLRGGLFMGGFVLAIPAGYGIGYGIGSLIPPPAPTPNGGLLSGANFAPAAFSLLGAFVLPAAVYIWNLTDAYSLNFEKNAAVSARQPVVLDAMGRLNWQISKF